MDLIAKTAGMHGAGMRYLDGQGSDIILSRDVKSGPDLGLTADLVSSPLQAQLLELKVSGINFEGSLKKAAAMVTREVHVASEGNVKFSIEVDPAISDNPVQFGGGLPRAGGQLARHALRNRHLGDAP